MKQVPPDNSPAAENEYLNLLAPAMASLNLSQGAVLSQEVATAAPEDEYLLLFTALLPCE